MRKLESLTGQGAKGFRYSITMKLQHTGQGRIMWGGRLPAVSKNTKNKNLTIRRK